jgi:hypothetical protein
MPVVLPLAPTSNRKLVGKPARAIMFATYREVGATCPASCPLLNAGCYAQGGPTGIHARRGSYDATDGTRYRAWVDALPYGATVRLHVSGDVMMPRDDGTTAVDTAYLGDIVAAAHARPDVTVYGYTHAWRDINRAAYDMPPNLTINASCDDDDAVAEARAAGWDTTTVVPSDTAWRRNGSTVVCPNQTIGLSCAECKLCMRSKRTLTVAFRAHGASTRRVDSRLRDGTE